MQFTLADCSTPSHLEQFFQTMLLALFLVGIPLLLWLLRGPRDSRDVLGSAPASLPSALQERLGRVGMTVLCIEAVLLGVFLIRAAWKDSFWGFGPRDLSSLEGTEAFFALSLLITPWVVIPLVRWLERSPRIGTGMAAQGRIGLVQRLGDLLGWGSVTTVLAVPVLFAMFILAGIEESSCESMLFNEAPLSPSSLAPNMAPSMPAVTMMVVLTVLGAVLRAWWLRSNTSEQDVLHIGTRSS